MYLVYDCYDDIRNGKINNRKQLKDLWASEIFDDAMNNIDDNDIVLACLCDLRDLVKDKMTDKQIFGGLESFGWKVINLLDLQRDLEDVKGYMENKCFIGGFNEVIDLINKECNKVC